MKAFPLIPSILCLAGLLASCRPSGKAPSLPEPSTDAAFVLARGAWHSDEGGSDLRGLFAGIARPVEGSHGLRMAMALPTGACAAGGRRLVYCPSDGASVAVDLDRPVRELLGVVGRGDSWKMLLCDDLGVLALDPRNPAALSRIPPPLSSGSTTSLSSLGPAWLALASSSGSLALYGLPDLTPGPAARGLPDILDMAWAGESLALLGRAGRVLLIPDPSAEDLVSSIVAIETDPAVDSIRGGPAGLIASGGGRAFLIPAGATVALETAALSGLQEPLPYSGGFVVRTADGRLCLLTAERVEGAWSPVLDDSAFFPDARLSLSARAAGADWLLASDLGLSMRNAASQELAHASLSDPPLEAPFLSAGSLWYLGAAALWRIADRGPGNGYPIPAAVLSNILSGLGNLGGVGAVTETDLDILPWKEGQQRPFARSWRVHPYHAQDGSPLSLSSTARGRYLIVAFDAEGNALANNLGYEIGEQLPLVPGAGKDYWFAISPPPALAALGAALSIRRGGD